MGNYHKIGHVCLCVCVSVCLSVSILASSTSLFSIEMSPMHGPLSKPIENGWNGMRGLTSRGQSSQQPVIH